MPSQTIVVKCGGSATLDRDAICADVASLAKAGHHMVLVHGGAADIDALAARLGVRQRVLSTPSGSPSRYTDPATLEVLLLAMTGLVKPALVTALARHGARPVGLTGLDGDLLTARRPASYPAMLDGRKVVIRDDHSGRITGVDATVLRALHRIGAVPVLSPPAMAAGGQPVNVNADRVAAAVAVALHASALVLLTAAPGLLASAAAEESVLRSCSMPAEGEPHQAAAGGMRVKLHAGRQALAGGVGEVVIADGRLPRPVISALAGGGTRLRLDPAHAAGS
jgi:[amino group carrier protein]-L-2-aminoadipate 6-kinase